MWFMRYVRVQTRLQTDRQTDTFITIPCCPRMIYRRNAVVVAY